MTEKTNEPDDILTPKEIEEVRLDARKRLTEAKKKSAKAALLAKETERLKLEEGLVTGNDAKDEMVNITLNLPEFAALLNINGRPYWHNYTYTVPRHLADTLREMQGRAWAHQDEIDGQSKTQHYARARSTTLSPSTVKNAPQAAA